MLACVLGTVNDTQNQGRSKHFPQIAQISQITSAYQVTETS